MLGRFYSYDGAKQSDEGGGPTTSGNDFAQDERSGDHGQDRTGEADRRKQGQR